jgi:hypothetical protein
LTRHQLSLVILHQGLDCMHCVAVINQMVTLRGTGCITLHKPALYCLRRRHDPPVDSAYQHLANDLCASLPSLPLPLA